MKILLTICGVLASLFLLAVSAFMNWTFGHSLGASWWEGQAFGGLSAGVDVLKALAPFFALWAFSRRHKSAGVAAVLAWVVFTGYSLTSGYGFAALNRTATSGERSVEIENRVALQEELTEAKAVRDRIGLQRSPETVEAAITALLATTIRHGRRSRMVADISKQCTKSHYLTRRICNQVINLRAELVVARDYVKASKRVTGLRSRLAKARTGARIIDPQVKKLSQLTGQAEGWILQGLLIFLAIVAEVGSGLGLYISLGHLRVPAGIGVYDQRNEKHVMPGAEESLDTTPKEKLRRRLAQRQGLHLVK